MTTMTIGHTRSEKNDQTDILSFSFRCFLLHVPLHAEKKIQNRNKCYTSSSPHVKKS